MRRLTDRIYESRITAPVMLALSSLSFASALGSSAYAAATEKLEYLLFAFALGLFGFGTADFYRELLLDRMENTLKERRGGLRNTN